jgi:hypothetical protein
MAGNQVDLLILVIFAPESGPRRAKSMRIHVDPDPQHCLHYIACRLGELA